MPELPTKSMHSEKLLNAHWSVLGCEEFAVFCIQVEYFRFLEGEKSLAENLKMKLGSFP